MSNTSNYSVSEVDLSTYKNDSYQIGANQLTQLLWYAVNACFFNSPMLLPYAIKNALIRIFGAKIGHGVIIKPRVNIKYPWKLEINNNSWIGEGVWIDNLDKVIIGKNVCISQGALILSGNHDYSKPTFDLIVKKITIDDGAWIGAKSIITQGVHVGSHAVLVSGSLASSDLESFGIYRGNPASKVKTREIKK